MSSASKVRTVYKEMCALFSREYGPDSTAMRSLRESFRKPLDQEETLAGRIALAESRLAVLRMSTPKLRTEGGTSRWVYKDGKKVKHASVQTRGGNNRVVSNFDGKNLDPESVQTHKQQLRRAGFVNNTHAKGLF